MGTRSLTYIVDGEKPIACMYQQYDGYPSGVGASIASFLDGKKIVNGISGNDAEIFNGLGDLGARLFAALKENPNKAGGCYLVDPSIGQSEEYNYFVSIEGDYYQEPGNCTILIKVFVGSWADGKEILGNEIFRGTPAELLAFKEGD